MAHCSTTCRRNTSNNGFVEQFNFGVIVTVFLFRSFIVRKNISGTDDWRLIFLGVLCFLWVGTILEIANSIWEVIQENGDYSLVYVSPTINGFIIGLVVHILLINKPKYAGKN